METVEPEQAFPGHSVVQTGQCVQLCRAPLEIITTAAERPIDLLLPPVRMRNPPWSFVVSPIISIVGILCTAFYEDFAQISESNFGVGPTPAGPTQRLTLQSDV